MRKALVCGQGFCKPWHALHIHVRCTPQCNLSTPCCVLGASCYWAFQGLGVILCTCSIIEASLSVCAPTTSLALAYLEHLVPSVVSGVVPWLQVRQLSDSAGDTSEAGPSIAVQMIGLNAVPVAGDEFCVCESDQQACQTLLQRRTKCMCSGAARLCLLCPCYRITGPGRLVVVDVCM